MKKTWKRGCGCLLGTIVVLGAVIAIAAYVMKPKWHDEYGQRFLDVAYGSRTHNTYDLYLPTDAAGRDSLALILYVHGGSWLGGEKEMHQADCYTWVQKGYATATMDYSLLNEDSVSIPTMLDEIGRCVEHIKGYAAEHGTTIGQMAIAGTSAGGHLAMLYAYSRTHALPLRFVAEKVGPSDLRILFPSERNAKPEDITNFVFCLTGKHMDATQLTDAQQDSIKLLASPVNYINDSTALPAIFAYGEKDELVKPAHYRVLTERYDSLGKRYDLIVYPNSNHFLMSDKDCSERYDSMPNAYCKTYFGY